MGYQHTQRGGIHHILLFAAAVELAGAWLVRQETAVAVLLLGIVAIFVLFASMFATLTIRDEGQWLALRYGPVPLFRKQIRYADITSVESDRTRLIDGWGIHWIPGRGWTYNLWGFRCVKLTLGKKTIRIGSDDAENLAALLKTKIDSPASS